MFRAQVSPSKNEKPNSLVATLNAWRLEDLLDVPSYGEPLGEAILQRMRKLESKRRRFPPLQNRYGHGRTGRTIAAGPESCMCNQTHMQCIM